MEVAARSGLSQFQNVRLEPITISDCNGGAHHFHFRVRLLGDILSLEAFELNHGAPSGYQLQLIGDPNEELLAMVGRMVQKIRRALAVKHLTTDSFDLQIADQCVKGRVEQDDLNDERQPLVVIDGRPVSWRELGNMLMSFEC